MQYTVEKDDSDPYEGVPRSETRITLTLTVEELLLLVNAVGHAKNSMADDEFHALIGVDLPVARTLHGQLGSAFDESSPPHE